METTHNSEFFPTRIFFDAKNGLPRTIMGMGNIFGQASQDLKKPIGAFRCWRVTKKNSGFFPTRGFLDKWTTSTKIYNRKRLFELSDDIWQSLYIYIFIFIYLDIYVFFFCCWKCFSWIHGNLRLNPPPNATQNPPGKKAFVKGKS